jgi:hypothetical protein
VEGALACESMEREVEISAACIRADVLLRRENISNLRL